MAGVALMACAKKDACPEAKRAATTALVAAIQDSEVGLPTLERAVPDVEGEPGDVEDERKEWDYALSSFERAFACDVHDDCCARAAKATPEERKQHVRAGAELHLLRVPVELDEIQAPINAAVAVYDVDEVPVTQWCEATLAAIEVARKQAPAAWQRMIAEAVGRVDAAKAALEMHRSRRRTLGVWSDAVLGNTETDPHAAPQDGDDSYDQARSAIARYQGACH